MKALIVGLLGLGTIVFLFFIMSIQYNNRDAMLRNSFVAKESDREVIYDETWKTIKQIAQVSDKYSKDFKEIYPELIAGRYGNARGGSLLSFITESNPTFDTSLYAKLTNVIEAKRSEFTNVQEELIDVKREHDNLLTMFPGSFFVRNQTRLKIILVSSDKSKETVTTGIENDVDLF